MDSDSPKRKWKRCKVDMRVRLRQWETPENAASVVRTFELSEGGMSIYASETLEAGTRWIVEFSLPQGEGLLKINAVVRNRRGFRCGLEFVDILEFQQNEIARYLSGLADVIEI
jgi:c-di-GMP-binding flagellar brake protein YcgR